MTSPGYLWITPELSLPLGELELTYIRSSGPGGQNVNKVNSKARLRWNLRESPSVPPIMKGRLLGKLGSKLTTEGDLILTADTHRDQLRNREECLEKFRQLIVESLKVPKRRKPTAPSRSSQRKGKEKKRQHAEKKAGRKRIDY